MKKAAAKEPARKKPAAKKRAARAGAAGGLPELYYRGHALLTTVRCIAQHEDRLCVLLHEVKRRGTAGVAVTKELRALLGEMPAEDYGVELRALEDELR